MSVYIDTITFVWAIGLLFVYAQWLLEDSKLIQIVGFLSIGSYLVAQSGWTTAFLLGDVWGRDLSNYIWFIFNSLVLGLLTMIWLGSKRK